MKCWRQRRVPCPGIAGHDIESSPGFPSKCILQLIDEDKGRLQCWQTARMHDMVKKPTLPATHFRTLKP